MEFRPRNYTAENEAFALPTVPADNHPLSAPSVSHQPVDAEVDENYDFFDPLRGPEIVVSVDNLQDAKKASSFGPYSGATVQHPKKEWTSFKRLLLQRFPVSKMVSITPMSDVILRSGKAFEKSSTSTHPKELDDPQKFAEEGIKVITRQEYVSRLHELKDEITHAWDADDHVTALKLSIKVARLLMDTSVLPFYPTLFVHATDILDMLGDMVWERIKQKAEFVEDGNILCPLPENFQASNICIDAKETCNNWFCKVGSIRELLPRIYLELAILPCWRFLLDRPLESLQRLVMMTRGLADPLVSTYCRLYIAHCAQKFPTCDMGFLITPINDTKILLVRIVSANDTMHEKFPDNERLLVSLMEPTIEYIIKCILNDASQKQVRNILVELGLGRNQDELFGNFPYVSIVLHYLLKELPTEVLSSSATEILHLIECSNDYSFNQFLNFRLLGFRLCESITQTDMVTKVMDKVIQVVTRYDSFYEYLKVVDPYVDIVLLNRMDNHLNTILEGITNCACNKWITEEELETLQSILMKILYHFNNLEDLFALSHFHKILDLMYGSPKSIINMNILKMATRSRYIGDPRTIQLLFEISQALHDSSYGKDDDNQQSACLVSRFVHRVDYGAEMEHHLTFLIECRGAFGNISELKEILIRTSNCLAIKALKDAQKHLNFFKSCIAFSEVTLPAISASIKQCNLYIETAEVALLGGLVSHSEGLINSTIKCLQSLNSMNGSQTSVDVDGILSLIQKLCSLLVMVPGNPKHGVTYIPKTILSLVNTQSWMTTRMKIRISCAIVSLSATLSQNKLPYHASYTEIPGNDLLFFGDPSYLRELVSFSEFSLQNMVDTILQEPAQATRGSLALEACNCIASSFKMNKEISQMLSKLVENAKLCLSSEDKYLQSTIKLLRKRMSSSQGLAISTAGC